MVRSRRHYHPGSNFDRPRLPFSHRAGQWDLCPTDLSLARARFLSTTQAQKNTPEKVGVVCERRRCSCSRHCLCRETTCTRSGVITSQYLNTALLSALSCGYCRQQKNSSALHTYCRARCSSRRELGQGLTLQYADLESRLHHSSCRLSTWGLERWVRLAFRAETRYSSRLTIEAGQGRRHGKGNGMHDRDFGALPRMFADPSVGSRGVLAAADD